MAVFLSGYGNLNYRSLGGEGIYLDELSDINIIIGQNNGGKSNILRSISVWESSRRGTPQILHATDYYENDSSNQIEFEFVLPVNMVNDYAKLVELSGKRPFIRYKLIGDNQYSIIDSFVRHADPDFLRSFCNTKLTQSSGDHTQNINSIENQGDFQHSLNQVPAVIHIDEKRVQATSKNIRDRLEPIWNHGAGNTAMRPIRSALKSFIEEGMESRIDIQFEPGGESFSIATSDDDLVTFESLGSGFQQIFNLALTIASTKDSLVLIDEPELNMHPTLLRRLMKLIFSNNTNQYIISTHSNVLLDAEHQKTLYQVIGGKSSTLKKCNTLEDSRMLLDDLGAKASDILQTNGVIWVEGPSDRTYIKRWLELNGSKAEEGLDYSFQYYGGKLLAHYTVDDDIDEFINILDLSRNALLVIDSDWKDSAKSWEIKDLADRKQKIIEECDQKEIPYWVTNGNEIENYISDSIWTEYAGTKIELPPTEKVTKLIPKYTIKAKEAHKVAELITAGDINQNEELLGKIKQLRDSITKWNTI